MRRINLTNCLTILCILTCASGLLFADRIFPRAGTAFAATVQGPGLKWERELGRQKLTPTSSTALTMPAGTKHVEFYVDGGTCLVTWNGGAPVDSATGAMKWPDGHFRKEANDGPKLSGFRALCSTCTLWVDYFGDRQVGQ